MQDIIIIGASDTFDLVRASFDASAYRIIGYLGLTRNEHSAFLDNPYLGDDSVIESPDQANAAFVVAVYDNEKRRDLVNRIDSAGKALLSPRHPDCTIYTTATCKDGVLVAPHAVISTHAKVGRSVYVHFSAVVGHDVTVGDFSFISPGVQILGEATIGSGVLLGANSVVLAQVTIGDNVKVAANTVVKKDVPANMTVMSEQKIRTFDAQ